MMCSIDFIKLLPYFPGELHNQYIYSYLLGKYQKSFI